MFFYIALYTFGVIGSLHILNHSKRTAIEDAKEIKGAMNRNMKGYFYVYCTILIALSCLRYGIGTDYFLYEKNFTGSAGWWEVVDLRGAFGYLVRLFAALHIPYQVFIALFAYLSLTVIFKLALKYSWNPILTVTLLVGLSFYSFSMSGFRQFAAIAILIYAIHINCENERNRKLIIKTLIWLVIAGLFHQTSLLASVIIILLIFWNPKKKQMQILNGVFLVLFVLTRVFIVQINHLISLMVSMTGYYANYLNYIGAHYYRLYSQGTSLYNTLLLIPCLFFLYRIISDFNASKYVLNKFSYTALKIFYFYQLFLCFNMSSEMIDRFLFYFSIMAVFVYPMFIRYAHIKYGKRFSLALGLFIICVVGYMFTRYLSTNAYGIIPYDWIF